MDSIKHLYVNLKKDDEDYEELQGKVDELQKSVGKNKQNLAEVRKQIESKQQQNTADGKVSDEDWNKQFGFVLSAESE